MGDREINTIVLIAAALLAIFLFYPRSGSDYEARMIDAEHCNLPARLC